MNIEIVSLGISNTASVANMFRKIGLAPTIVAIPSESQSPDWYVLPGVGAFDSGAKRLAETGWDEKLQVTYRSGSSGIMGICLGMQLLCDGSDEGRLPGLGLIPGRFRHFRSLVAPETKVPHMGWNEVEFDRRAAWTTDLPPDSRFYFVHSFFYSHPSDAYVIGRTIHGQSFASVIQRERVIGFQFHPEKSHRFGKTLLRVSTSRL